MPKTTYNRGLHLLALLTAIATFPLIFMGGLVTSKQAGLAVPDWPNSFGYNMFLFPPSQWVGGIFYEHVHRLAGTVVGLLAMALALWAWVTERRRSIRWLALAVLGGVIVQGVLGGLRVVLVQLDLAIVHACIGQAFFCLTALMVIVSSRWWTEEAPAQVAEIPDRAAGRPLIRLAALATCLIFLQLIAGAVMRHYQAGLAIPDLPLAYGQLVPSTDPDALRQINQQRVADGLGMVTAGQVWIHFAHRMGALVVTAAIALLLVRIFRRHREETALAGPAWLLLDLLAVQLVLGVLTVLLRKPADIATAHVAVGALVLVTSFIITVRSAGLYGGFIPAGPRRVQPAPAAEEHPAASRTPTALIS